MNYSHCKDCLDADGCPLVSYDPDDDNCAYEILTEIRETGRTKAEHV